MYDSQPVPVGFPRSEATVGKVRDGYIKTDSGRWGTRPIGPMAGNTGGGVQLLISPFRFDVTLLLRIEGCGVQKQDRHPNSSDVDE